MAHKKQGGAPVPPGNRSQAGVPGSRGKSPPPEAPEVGSAQEQDPKRRLGDFEGKGEHSLQEPGGKNDANH
jgi:hypothetical protein